MSDFFTNVSVPIFLRELPGDKNEAFYVGVNVGMAAAKAFQKRVGRVPYKDETEKRLVDTFGLRHKGDGREHIHCLFYPTDRWYTVQERGAKLAASAQCELRRKWGYEAIDIHLGEVFTREESGYALRINYQGEGFYIYMEPMIDEWQNKTDSDMVDIVCRIVRDNIHKEAG